MYQVGQPSKHLSPYIDHFWSGEQELDGTGVFFHNAVASSKLELQFHCAGHFLTPEAGGRKAVVRAGFFGQCDTCRHYFAGAAKTAIFSVRLYPRALTALFRLPAYLLTNGEQAIDAVLNQPGAELAERIFNAATFHERVELVESFVEQRLRTTPPSYRGMDKLLANIHGAGPPPTVKEMAAQACLSGRQFERIFKTLTGFAARDYLKVIRFERVEAALAGQAGLAPPRLTDLALQCGYYDQSHLNRDFKAFTGTTPTDYGRYLASKP